MSSFIRGEPSRQVTFTTTTTTTTVVTQTTPSSVVQTAGQPVSVVVIPPTIAPAPISVATKAMPPVREQVGSRSIPTTTMTYASSSRGSDREARPAVTGRVVPVEARRGEPARRY